MILICILTLKKRRYIELYISLFIGCTYEYTIYIVFAGLPYCEMERSECVGVVGVDEGKGGGAV